MPWNHKPSWFTSALYWISPALNLSLIVSCYPITQSGWNLEWCKDCLCCMAYVSPFGFMSCYVWVYGLFKPSPKEKRKKILKVYELLSTERQKHKQIWNCDRCSNYVGKGSWTTAQGGVNKCWIDFGECFSRLFISVTELWILNKRNESSNNMARVILPCQRDGKPRWNRILFALFEINGFCLSGIRWTLTRTNARGTQTRWFLWYMFSYGRAKQFTSTQMAQNQMQNLARI